MTKYSKDSDAYESAIKDSKDALHTIKIDTLILDNFKKENYQTAYKYASIQNDEFIKVAKKDPTTSSEMLKALQREGLRITALKKSGVREQSEDYPVDGLGFLVNSLRYVLPILISIIIIFVLSQTYSERFIEQMDIGNLIPLRRSTINNADALSGIIATFGMCTVISFFIFGIASIISGPGHWSYPMFKYINGSNSMEFIETGKILLNTLVITMIYLVFIVLVCELVCLIFKNRLISLFISLIFLIGLPLAPWIVIPMQKFAHLLPTTYLFSVLTVTGELRITMNNPQITQTMGIIVLFLSCLIVYVIILAYEYFQYSNRGFSISKKISH